jgi:hypothetical protein
MFDRPPPLLSPPPLDVPLCLQHAANPVSSYCVRCGRPMCELCTFWVGSALFCPECLSSGPSADERSTVSTRGFLSIALSVLGIVLLAALFAAGLLSAAADGILILVGVGLLLLCALGGVSLGLIGREGAARTGSMLPLIGIVLNGVILGLCGIFALFLVFKG